MMSSHTVSTILLRHARFVNTVFSASVLLFFASVLLAFWNILFCVGVHHRGVHTCHSRLAATPTIAGRDYGRVFASLSEDVSRQAHPLRSAAWAGPLEQPSRPLQRGSISLNTQRGRKMRFKRALKRGQLKRVLNRRFNRAIPNLGEGNWQGTLQPLRRCCESLLSFFF